MGLKITRRILLLPLLLLLPMIGSAKDSLPDPTRPPASLVYSDQSAAATTDTKLDLHAIFFSNDRRLAVINDQRLREKDRIGTAQILRIMPDRVRLTRDGGEFELTLIRFDIKALPKGAQPKTDGSAATPTKTFAQTAGSDAATGAATNAPVYPIEAWGGSSTAPPTPSNTHADSPAAPSTARPGMPLGGDRNDPSSTLQSDGARPSGNQTPSWVDSLLGEGKEK